MSDIYTSEDGDAIVDLEKFSARYEERIYELKAEIYRQRQQIASLEEALRVARGGCRKL